MPDTIFSPHANGVCCPQATINTEFPRPPDDHRSEFINTTRDLVQRQFQEVLASTETGWWFNRSDTGSGKTTGLVAAIAYEINHNGSNSRLVIAVPTSVDVESMYQALSEAGIESLARWSRKHETGEDGLPIVGARDSSLTTAQVLVGTHQWILDEPGSQRWVGDRDLCLVDEIPPATKTQIFRRSLIVEASEEVRLAGLDTDPIRMLEDWARSVEQGITQDTYQVPHDLNHIDLSEYQEIAQRGSKAQTVIGFLEATKQGRAFIRVSGGSRETSFVFYIQPRNAYSKTLVYSATADLEGFQYSRDGAQRLAEQETRRATYERLLIHRMEYDASAYTREVLRSQEQTSHICNQILRAIDRASREAQILLVLPKDFIPHWERHLETQDFPPSNLYITNWGRDVGSNAYRQCSEVILVGLHYKPAYVTMGEYCAYAGITAEQGIDRGVAAGRVIGEPHQLGRSQRLAQIKQMACRGSCRYLDDYGSALPLRLTLLANDITDQELVQIFPGATIKYEVQHNWRARLRSPMQKISYLLAQSERDRITRTEMLDLLGITHFSNGTRLAISNQNETWRALGWEYLNEGPGRGRFCGWVRIVDPINTDFYYQLQKR